MKETSDGNLVIDRKEAMDMEFCKKLQKFEWFCYGIITGGLVLALIVFILQQLGFMLVKFG